MKKHRHKTGAANDDEIIEHNVPLLEILSSDIEAVVNGKTNHSQNIMLYKNDELILTNSLGEKLIEFTYNN